MENYKFIISLMLLLCFHTSGFSQITNTPIKTNKALEKKLDSIFSSYNKTTPGVAVTVIENGKVIAKKAYGLASLEFGVPFSHNTVVRLPYSEGREFISIAAVLMEQEGLLKLEDKVRKYYPELPAWSEPVTIRDLLNHRSGFADEWANLLLSQASMTNRFDKSQFLNFLCRQPKAEVEPGKGYMYSNSDFGLLRLILEKASDQNLQQWMKTNLFDPLKMNMTLLHDDKDIVIEGFALQYYNYGNGYKTWTSDKTSPGGNYYIATTVNDLEKWAAAHADSTSFISNAVKSLFVNPQLMPGRDKDYVFGYTEKSLGNNEIYVHQGVSDHSYLSSVKNKGITVILLSNETGATFPYHEKILSHLLDIKQPPFSNKLFKKEKVQYSFEDLKQFTGIYLEEDSVTYESFTEKRTEVFELLIDNDSLKMKWGNEIFPLEYISWGVFKDVEYPSYIEFSPDKADNNKAWAHIHQNNQIINLIKNQAQFWQPTTGQLKSFEGKYYSPHLDNYWTIVLNEKNNLIVKRSNIADTELEPHINEEFRMWIDKFPGDSFSSWVKFHIDNNGKTTHLTVHDSRLMHHRFDKL
ncbi:CubicO group peptidase, beta-lactamase class C family [Flavobacteriaceae bacterium MAR_2010_188]|nr:CubicO group peptidase, beta-lactamase class C family [Flavobacteriaceae bacterium MAR_2010_188]